MLNILKKCTKCHRNESSFPYNDLVIPTAMHTHIHLHSFIAQCDPQVQYHLLHLFSLGKMLKGGNEDLLYRCQFVPMSQQCREGLTSSSFQGFLNIGRTKNHQTIINEKSSKNGRMLINMSYFCNTFRFVATSVSLRNSDERLNFCSL